jgi:hypothetical protein
LKISRASPSPTLTGRGKAGCSLVHEKSNKRLKKGIRINRIKFIYANLQKLSSKHQLIIRNFGRENIPGQKDIFIGGHTPDGDSNYSESL